MNEDLGGEVGQDHVGVGHDVVEVVETKELVTFCSAAAWESCKPSLKIVQKQQLIKLNKPSAWGSKSAWTDLNTCTRMDSTLINKVMVDRVLR